MEALVDVFDAGVVLLEDREEVGVFRVLDGLGDKAEEDGDLELDLVSVDAVENAVELGVAEGEVEGVDVFGFGLECGGGRGSFFDVLRGKIVSELAVSAGEGVGEGSADSAEAGGFEGRVEIFDGFVEAGGAEIELFREVGGFCSIIAEEDADGDDKRKGDNGADDDFKQEASESGSAFSLNGAVVFRDLIEILEVVHEYIITRLW